MRTIDTASEDRELTYDKRGRLTAVATGDPPENVVFRHGPDERRTARKDAAGTVTRFFHDGTMAYELDNDGVIQRAYIFEPGGYVPLMQLVPDGQGDVDVFFHHNDHLDTPRLVTDASGNIVWRGWHEPFGKMHEACGPGCDGPCNFHQPPRFPGQWDYGDGVSYSWHRYVLPDYGIFLSPDPLPLSGNQSLFHVPGNGSDGLRLWSYSLNSPLLATDPDGRSPLLLLLGAAALAAGCTAQDLGESLVDLFGDQVGAEAVGRARCNYCACVGEGNDSPAWREHCCEGIVCTGQACNELKADCISLVGFSGLPCGGCD